MTSKNYSIEEKALLISLGLTIKKNRLNKNISQEELADMCGLHRTYVSSVERGERNVSLINLVSLSKALDIKLIELLKDI